MPYDKNGNKNGKKNPAINTVTGKILEHLKQRMSLPHSD